MIHKIYPCEGFPHLIHGGDYSPEQWLHQKDIWDRDMELLRQAHCNELTVGIFSWSTLEPREGEWDFSFLDEIIEKIGAAGGKVILATPSGARPRWLAEQYPEVLRVRPDGQREHFRARHNHCHTSPVYREKVAQINRRLAQRYGNNPTVIAWHLSNEYGGECHCPLCTRAFQDYLREKFHNDIGQLNQAYWTTFWSHTYDRFDQIEAPGPLTEDAVHGLNLDWRRFVTHQTMDFIRHEAAALREYSQLPVTANLMYAYDGLDYNRLGEVIDFASWDAYPEWHSKDDAIIAQQAAFWHDFYRTLKKKPFLLMESTPSLVNWKSYNRHKRRGLDTLSSLQAVAHGSDSVQYFQWRKGRGSSEKLHGAVVGHDGTADTRVFRSVAATGQILEAIDEVAGTLTHAKAAIVFDWENWWALNDAQGYAKADKKYVETCYEYHRIFWARGIGCDIVSPREDLSRYALVVAPMLYLTDRETIQNLKGYVSGGGTLYGTYMMGTVDTNDLCWLGGIPAEDLKAVFGILAEEIDTLYPGQKQHAALDGQLHELVDYCEVIRLRGAEALAVYADGDDAGNCAVSIHDFGSGRAIYQACRDTGSLKEQVLGKLIRALGIPAALGTDGALPHGVSAQTRTDGQHTYLFLENFSDIETHTLPLPGPCLDLLAGEVRVSCTLPPYGWGIFRREG